jgi:23S rRNA (adenine1618-N6)-methyltransferase
MAPKQTPNKPGLHSRNRFRQGYDFKHLAQVHPPLGDFMTSHEDGRPSIDYADAQAVKALNKALLLDAYKLDYWDIPDGYLCPPIPGRSDYIHNLADLLAIPNRKVIPRGEQVAVLDIGTGANVIYPIIGIHEYGWSFVGSDVDSNALASAEKIMRENESIKARFELRLQSDRSHMLDGLILKDDQFDATMCNPPFFGSEQESQKAGQRKFRNLGKREPDRDIRNFGGSKSELWIEGGELGFVSNLIKESRNYRNQVLWFTSMVSKKENLPAIYNMFDDVNAVQVKTVAMSQGLKTSRFVAWSYLNAEQQEIWAKHRFPPK